VVLFFVRMWRGRLIACTPPRTSVKYSDLLLTVAVTQHRKCVLSFGGHIDRLHVTIDPWCMRASERGEKTVESARNRVGVVCETKRTRACVPTNCVRHISYELYLFLGKT
jgi:hypothetical protein